MLIFSFINFNNFKHVFKKFQSNNLDPFQLQRVSVSNNRFIITTMQMNVQSQDSIQVVIRIKPNPSGSFLSYDEASIGLGKANFSFDHVFLPDSTQHDVYKLTGCKQMEHTLEGYNSCLFVYGQTGSGKTHTMIGNNNGIVQQSLYHLFGRMTQNVQSQYNIRCSYFEIYNQQLFDLLDPNKEKKLAVREDIKRGVFVEGLTQQVIDSAERGIVLLNQGVRTRHVGETLMNRESSRSHAIFSLSVENKQVENGHSILKKSKIHFVDLAGSQRQKSTAALGERLKEASNINKSLTTLGMVINCLSGDKSKAHVPFRDSKLTFVLRDSLSGNSKTFLIATIADSESSLQQTLSTLKFAQRAKLVKLNASINQESLSLNVESLKCQIRRLKDELSRMNFELEQEKSKKTSTSCNKIIVNSYQQSMENLNEKIDSLVGMIPKLLEKDSGPEHSVQQYIKNNTQMLSDMSQSLSRFMTLKNQVRMKASLEKLRMQDLTPYKQSVSRLNIRRDINLNTSDESHQIQRILKEKREFEDKVHLLLKEQETMRREVDTVFQEKSNQYSILLGKMGDAENRAFELEQANNNLFLELEMIREKLTKSEQELRQSQQQIFSEQKVIIDYEHKLSSSGLYIDTLSKEMEQLHHNISNSARKHRHELEDAREIVNMKERELEELEKRHQIYLLQWEDEKRIAQGEKDELQLASVNVMKRLEEEMQKNDQVEARNIKLESIGEEKSKLAEELRVTVEEAGRRQAQLEQAYKLKINQIFEDNKCKQQEIISLQAQLKTSINKLAVQSRIQEELQATINNLHQSNNEQLLLLRSKVSHFESVEFTQNKQIQDIESRHLAQIIEIHRTYSAMTQESSKLKERCNELVAANYKLKNSRVPQQVDTTEISSKLDYYEQKFNLMKIQYLKSVETVRVLKQRQILIKEQNMRLSDSIKNMELQVELDILQDPNEPLKSSRRQKETKSNRSLKTKEYFRESLKDIKGRDKQNDSNQRNNSLPLNPESLTSLRQMIARLECEMGDSSLTADSIKMGNNFDELLRCLEDTIRKKESKLKKEIEKETKLKSQNHLILKQNLYLKQKIRNIENPTYLTITPTKKLKLN